MSIIMPGAEPFFHPGGRIGCLLTHGFTATPQEVHGLGTFLADQGVTVLGVRLAGHGTTLKDMSRTRWQDWLHSLDDGYAMLADQCDKIFLAGLSTGGVLSLLLSMHRKAAGLITMSTPIALPPIKALLFLYPLLPLLSTIIPSLPKGPPDWHDPEAGALRVAYDSYPLRSVYEFGKLVDHLRPNLRKVRTPILMMHSINDGFIPVEHMRRMYESVASTSKESFTVEHSNHIITCDAERQKVCQKAGEFIHQIVAN